MQDTSNWDIHKFNGWMTIRYKFEKNNVELREYIICDYPRQPHIAAIMHLDLLLGLAFRRSFNRSRWIDLFET